MSDAVFETFLARQLKLGMELARQSDLLDLLPIRSDRYVAEFHCKGLIRDATGVITEASKFHVAFWFPSYYLRRAEPLEIVTWLHPFNVWHPNIRPPLVCLGRISPGAELEDLIYQVFEVITYCNWASHDALNPEAAQWARNNQHRLPIDRRPLKRRTLNLEVTDEGATP
jgi:hypothetical protein